MRKPALLLLLCLSFHFCNAQRQKIDSLLQVIKKDLPDSTRMRCFYKIGKDFAYIDVDSSNDFVNRSLDIARKTNNQKAVGDCYSLLGMNCKNQGDYKAALNYHLESLRIKEELKDEYGMAIAFNDIGVLYKTMRRFDDAMKYYQKSNELCRKINLEKGVAMTYNNIGTIYRERRQPDSALACYQLALKQSEAIGDGYSISTCLSNVGDILYEQGKNKEALAIFQRCLVYDKENLDNMGMVYSYNNLGRINAALGDFSTAIKYSDSALTITLQEGLTKERLNTLGMRVEIKTYQKDYAAITALQSQMMQLQDSILNEETSKSISELQEKYNAEKREHDIAMKDAELKRKNYLIIGIAAFVLMLGLLSFSYYRRARLRQQAKLQAAVIEQQELATRAVIDAEERERKRIAGDLHDGVGQLMSAAKMNLSVIGSEMTFKNEDEKQAFDKALSLVDESCREVRSVSHSIMPNALLRSGLASAVREFINKIDQRVIHVNLYAEGLHERIDPNTESVLYRIIQECVNNVIKHAAASQLDISLIKDEDGISVTIEDNGKGFDTSNKNNFAGIGVRNIQSRVEYLSGSVEWDSTPGNGTVVTIQTPA